MYCAPYCLLEIGGGVTKQSSVCSPVSVCRLEQKCFQLTTKRSGRLQQLQLCRQPVPCSRCGDTEKVLSPIRRRVRGTTRSPDYEARSADRAGIWATDVSKSDMYTSVCPRSDLWTIRHNLYWILSATGNHVQLLEIRAHTLKSVSRHISVHCIRRNHVRHVPCD